VNRQELMPLMIADDDAEDCALALDALAESRLANPVVVVRDGDELMDYLLHRGDYAPPHPAPRPALILLDLKMPRKDGFEVLREIRANPELRLIPIVVLTSSRAQFDIALTYKLGVNSFISKPVTFQGLVDTMKTLRKYWFSIVELPENGG
jgi:CheY-like chemotaxis protein